MKYSLILFLTVLFFPGLLAQTLLMTGDIAVVGINANNNSCGGTGGDDFVSFVCFKDITNGTTLDITDNGYERSFPGLWGDTEGTYRATRTGGTILAGTVITFKTGSFSCIYPDTNWTFNSINGGWNSFNLNSGGDQLFFMQNGVWSGYTDTIDNNATYFGGDILFGFNTKTIWAANGTTQQSNLPPNMNCFSMTPTSGTDFVKYTGPLTPATQKDWILRISTQANWTKYTSCALYNSGLPDYSSGVTFIITVPFNVDAGINDTVCQNQPEFNLGGTPSGGYWTGTGITDTLAGIFNPATSGAGNFDVTYIYNDAGCPYHDLKTVVIRPKPVITINPGSGESCAGINLNIISSISSGTAPFTQLWTGDTPYLNNTSILNPVFNSLSTGSYNLTLTVTDSKGCIGVDSLPIFVNANPTAAISPDSLQVCANSNAGLTGIPAGGSSVFSTHLWSGNTAILTGPLNQPDVTVYSGTAGNYNLIYTVTDSKGCKGNSSVSVIINPNPVLTITPVSQIICSGASTNIELTSNVIGTTFNWTVVQNSVTGATSGNDSTISQLLTNSGATTGTATYTITPTANSCAGTTENIVITVNPLPVVTINPVSQSICSNDATNLSLSSNVINTSFSWNVIQSGVSGASANSGSFITQTLSYTVSPGTVTYTVSGTAGTCTGSGTDVTVTVNPLPSITSATQTDVTICGGTDGTINIVATGDAPLSYSIDGGSTFVINGGNFTGLPMGNYPIAVKNNYDCIVYGTTLIIGVGGAPPAPAAGTNAIYCQGQTAINLTASIGSGGTLTWYSNPGLTTQIGTGPTLNPNAFLVADTNYFYVTETVSGCSSNSTTVTIIINALPAVTATPSTQIYCSGETTNIALTSSVAGTTFNWTVSQTGVTGGFDGNAPVISQTLLNDDTTNGTAIYSVTGTANSCTGSSTNITVTVNPLPEIISVSKTDITVCGGNNGIISITATGFAPLTFSIDNGTTYITNNGIFSDLLQGNYNIIVKNGYACTLSYTNNPVVINAGTAPPAPVAGVNTIYCQGQNAANLTATTGFGGTLDWFSDVLLTSQIGSGTSFNPNQYLQVDTNIFYVTETVNGCRSNPSTVTIIINALPDPGITVTINILCYGENTGAATASALNGHPPYSYLWQNNVSNATITGLSGNVYYHVTITDSVNCSAIDSIKLTQPSPLILAITGSHVKCKGESNGIATAIVSGGTQPYSYLWSNSATGNSINNLITGNYSLIITDNNNCTASDSFIITEPASALSINVIPVNGTCGGSNNGSIQTVTTGGTSPYNYYWSDNQTDSVAVNLSAGVYQVTVSDINDCQFTTSAVIIIPDSILLSVDTTKNFTSCQDNADAGLFLTVSGGTKPYTYLWSEGSTNKDIFNLSKGEYTVTVTDSLNCSISKSFEIKNISVECLEIPSAFTPNSDGNNDKWEIKNIDLYPGVRVEIYNRWGNLIFFSKGYSQPWDGKYNGTDVTAGSYIYIINLNNGYETYNGTITVIR